MRIGNQDVPVIGKTKIFRLPFPDIRHNPGGPEFTIGREFLDTAIPIHNTNDSRRGIIINAAWPVESPRGVARLANDQFKMPVRLPRTVAPANDP
jgi:hypothetical protein